MNDGFISIIKEAPVADYDSAKGITMKEIAEQMIVLANHRPRKPEYILSKYEAENLPLWQLNWLGENYMVLTSLEVHNIVKERFANQVSI